MHSPLRAMLAIVLVGLIAVAASAPASAAVVNRIVVEGNQRVDDETVRAYVTITPGENFGPSDVDSSIETLFATGLFEDVTITQSGGALIVRVVENPVISRISFEGNRRITDQILTTTVTTRERSIFSRAKVQADVQRILDAYRAKGSFSASVEPQTIDRGQNRVDLIFNINEGAKTSVARVTFIGNESFSDGRLRDLIQTKESGLLGFIRTTDTYEPSRLENDQALLRRFYFNHGFADFRILSATADFDRERNQFFVTFTLDEGQRYDFGDVRVDTTLADLNPEMLRRQVQSRPGRRYSAEKIENSLEELTLAANRQGYPFAQVIPTGERNFENNTIDVVYRIDQGVRAFIERIEIVGNTVTRDYVIRREFDISEGDAYNRILIDRAERRLRRLGFFETVVIQTRQGSAPDRIVLIVQVLEKATGKVSFGVGYSGVQGVVGDLSITETNFLGRGQFVKAAISGGLENQRFDFSFTEPYLFGRRLAAGFDFFSRRDEENEAQAYDSDETGGTLRATVPLTENVSVQGFYRLTTRNVTVDQAECRNGNLPLAICESEGNRVTSLVGTSLIHNSLDDRFNPREGFYSKSTVEVAGLGGDSYYVRTTSRLRYYQELLPSVGLLGIFALEGGALHSLNDDLRIQDQFRLGGGTLRGFEPGGVGPRDRATGDTLGGRYYIAATAETTFPVPFLPPEIGLTGAAFVDAGSLWSVDPDIVNRNGGSGTIESDDFAMRVSGGLGLVWRSPFGPLRADVAVPFIEEDGDRRQVFRISGGTQF